LDKNGWPLGGNTLYLDGHVEWKDFPVGLVKANNLAASPIRPHWAFNGNTAPYFWW
jgi:prepilin-type processing-associated H-X9-DG protein